MLKNISWRIVSKAQQGSFLNFGSLSLSSKPSVLHKCAYYYSRFAEYSTTATATRIMTNKPDDDKLFRSIGLKAGALKNIHDNPSIGETLKECIAEARVNNGCDASVGKLIFDIATAKQMNNSNAKKHRATLLGYVVNGGIANTVQLSAAYKYLSSADNFEKHAFEKQCGVGVVVTEAQITQTVDEVVNKYKAQLAAKGRGCLGAMYKEIRETLPWADGKMMNEIFQKKFNAALKASGFTQSDKKQNKSKNNKKEAKAEQKEEEEEVETMEKWLTGRELEVAKNTESQLQQRELALTGKGLDKNIFLSRFPPEPNGFLHIGHCKAMTFNFTLAEKKKGECYLRFDDTNPTTEKQEFIDSIVENVKWMGFHPWKVTFSSDYFRELYEFAIKMIKNGDAYVCHQSPEQMEAERRSFRSKKPKPSPYRNRSVEENLHCFELMRCGYYAEGEAVLRMKGDYNSPNPNMWDHVAYRVMYAEHPKSGDKWCIYPTYDYTHCICDSIEWITASCCTLEFENRRESYFWLLDVLDIYKPVVWEYSRLNLTYNVLSKRKLLVLVNDGYVRGWDDPRMLTIVGLRRRGFTASILRDFCNRVGVTRKDNFISPQLLQACAREEFNQTCSRAMAVIKPLKIVLSNYPQNKVEDIECPDFPMHADSKMHAVKFSKVVYIDADDFQSGQIKNKKFYGLTEGKTVRLKYAYNITCKKVVYKADSTEIDHLECVYDADHTVNVKKGHLTWVSSPVPAEFRLYDHLFTEEKPEGGEWLSQLNADSELIYQGFIDEYVARSVDEKGGRFQFERLGYFVKDADSQKCGYPVFNRTVTLTEGAKKAIKKGNQPQKAKKKN